MAKRYNAYTYMGEHGNEEALNGEYVLYEDHKREIDNLKCCGNCKHYGEENPETCYITLDWMQPCSLCDKWYFDGLISEQRIIK